MGNEKAVRPGTGRRALASPGGPRGGAASGRYPPKAGVLVGTSKVRNARRARSAIASQDRRRTSYFLLLLPGLPGYLHGASIGYRAIGCRTGAGAMGRWRWQLAVKIDN
jgi:hypothetical protein